MDLGYLYVCISTWSSCYLIGIPEKEKKLQAKVFLNVLSCLNLFIKAKLQTKTIPSLFLQTVHTFRTQK